MQTLIKIKKHLTRLVIFTFAPLMLIKIIIKFWQLQYFFVELAIPKAKFFQWPNGEIGAVGVLATIITFIAILGVVFSFIEEDK